MIDDIIEDKKEKNHKISKTYFNMGSEETGSIEIDLVSLRQKNEELRYLTISIIEPNPPEVDNSESDVKTTTFALDNEDSFLKLKNFFEQLVWND